MIGRKLTEIDAAKIAMTETMNCVRLLWAVDDSLEGELCIRADNFSQEKIAILASSTAADYDHARLIAAAPEMLSALESALEETYNRLDPSSPLPRKLREAIKKARGE